ncbi:MAG: malectin domain-containing carbohydrate-binding protein, partial [Pseudomonadota bacterium]
ITVDYTVTGDTADASDYTTAATGQIVVAAGQLSAELLIPIVDDADTEAAEGFTVQITGVSNTSGDAVIGDADATVTIAPSDNPLASAVPEGGAAFALDFETDATDPIADGVFDTVLGPQATAYIASQAAIEGGQLKIQTSNGDLSQGPDDASKNDLVKAVDLSSSDINEFYIRTVVDNPFDADFFASLVDDAGGQNITPGVIPNYAQLGIVIAVDDPTLNQDGTQFIKLIFGGNSGNATQMWTPAEGDVDGLNQVVKLPAVGTAAGQTIALDDIAKVELALVVDKAAGTIGQIVTYYDDAGNVLGGVRPVAEAGFVTAAPIAMTQPVIDAIANGTTVVGVLTTDFEQAGVTIPSFEAAFDLLEVTSPQISLTQDALVSIADVVDDVTESGDLENDLVIFELTAADGYTGDMDVTFSLDGGAPIAATVAFDAGLGSLEVDVPQDSRWNGETAEVTLVSIATAGYAVDAANATATATVLEDDPADTALGTVYGDLSDDRLAPTDIGTLALGDNEVFAAQQGDGAPGGRDRDYFTFTVADGQALSGLVLDGYVTTEESPAQAFMGIQEGTAITVDPITGAPDDTDGLLSGLIYGDGQQGTDLLPSLAEGGEIQTGAPIFAGFETPLAAGTYTLWLNQGGPSTSVTLNLVTIDPSVLDLELAIANAPTVLENGDTDSTALAFTVTANDASFSGDVTIDYTVDGSAAQSVVSFTSGVGTISVDVPNDDAFTGDTTVAVALTSADNSSDTFTVSATDGAASGIVRDDDVQTYQRGEVVAAFNAGGPAITQDGIDFVASAGNAAPFSGGASFTDNVGGNGLQPAFDGTVYKTEVNDNATAFGGGVDQGFSFSAPVDPNKSYFVDLYFAEIYATAVGGRKFDVEAEGTLVLDNYDVLAENGGDINAPVIVELTDPIQPGDNGAIDLSFIAETDRAKVSAIVI